MALQAAMHRAIEPIQPALSNAILFVDAPAALLLSSIEDSASAGAAAAAARGVDSLVNRMGVRNVVAMDDTIEAINNDTAPAASKLSDDCGWNNDLDFADVDDSAADEKKSSTGVAAASHNAPPSAPRFITILPIDLSHAAIDDPDVLALIDSATEDATAASTSPAAVPAASKSAAAKSDEWGWNDDDEANAAEEKSAVPVKHSAAKKNKATTKPGPPVRATSKACVWISGALSSTAIARVVKLVAHTRCGPAAFPAPSSSSSPEVLAFDDLHVFTSVSENAHVEDIEIGQSFATLEAQIVARVLTERSAIGEQPPAASKLKARIHFVPLAVAPLSASTFLAPASLPATASAAARVTTVPPALHLPSDASLASLLASAATSVVGVASAAAAAPTPSASSAPVPSPTGSTSSASSSSSLLGGFSVSNAFSNISKGLSDHIREAEAIAMQGADPNAAADATTGSAGAATASSTSSTASSLSAPLSCSLANLLLTLRIHPDFFALGPSASELASSTLSQLRSLKQQALVAETMALEEATEALRLHRKKYGQRSGAPPAPVIPAALPAWTAGSVLLVDRSLDLLSVAMHHSAAESMRDRLHDASESNETPQQESKQPTLTHAEMIEQLLATEVDPAAAPDLKHLSVDAEAVRNDWFGSSGASAEIAARHANFPAAPASAEARSLLHALDGLTTSSASGLGSSSAATKAVLTLLRKHLSKLVSSCGLEADSAGAGAGAASVALLGQECTRLLETLEEHRELRYRHREVLHLCRSILRSCCRSSSSSAPSLYDRLLSFEQLLMVQLLSNAATAAGSSANNPSEDESTRALRGLTQMVVDFINDATTAAGANSEESKRSSKASSKAAKESAAAAPAVERISIQETMRLLLFFFSLTGGKHLIPEAESKQLETALQSVIASAPLPQRQWIAQVCSLDSESELTEEITAKIVSSFFEQLRAVSVARSGLSAADLIDLCSPLESAATDGEDAAHEGGGFQPFLVRLLSRVFDPSSLVDDLESLPFGEEENAASSAGANDEDDSGASGSASTDKQHKKRDASSALASMTSDSSAPAAAAAPSGSGWSFLGSLASSVVSSVTSTASSLGFRHSTLRPGMTSGPLVIFVMGGLTHGELRRVTRMGEEWAKRVQAEEAIAAREARRPPTSMRSVIVGASHIATAQDTVEALLRSAAKDIRATNA